MADDFMSLLDERLARTAKTPFGQQVNNTALAAKPKPNTRAGEGGIVDGEPFYDWLNRVGKVQPPAAPVEPSFEDLLEERVSRGNKNITADMTAPSDPRIVTSPVPATGNRRLDRGSGIVQHYVASPSEYEEPITAAGPADSADPYFDSTDQIRLQNAREGVDYRRGIPFAQRMQIAAQSRIPSARGKVLANTLQEYIKAAPEGVPALRYDTRLDEWHVLAPITPDEVLRGFENEEDIGKFRYIAMDEADVTPNDIADLFNLGDIGALAGSMVGATAKAPLSFVTFASPTVNSAVGSLLGGVSGRLTGDAVSVITTYLSLGGDWVPTSDELEALGVEGATQEVLASIIGELGAGVFRWGSGAVQDAYARMTGRIGIRNTEDEVGRLNVNIARTKEDLERVRTVTGKQDIAVTRGQAARSLALIEEENSLIKSAKPSTQRQVRVARAQSDASMREFVDTIWGGNPASIANRHGTVIRANRALWEADKIVASTTDTGAIQFTPLTSPDSGFVLYPRGDTWQLQDLRLSPELMSSGMVEDLLMAAVKEAEAHGKIIVSDSTMTRPAMAALQEIRKSHPDIKLKFNETMELATDGAGRPAWVSANGRPLIEMEKPDYLIPKLLDRDPSGFGYMRPAQGADGRVKARKEFTRFLRRPGRSEMGQVVEEMRGNPFLRQDMREAVMADYEAAVNQNGFSVKAFEEWKDETWTALENFFTPEELVRIRKRGGLREVLDESRAKLNDFAGEVSRVTGLEPKFLFSEDPSKKIWDQLTHLPRGQVRRTMSLLDSQGMGNKVREIAQQELRDYLMPRTGTKGTSLSAAENLATWANTHKKLIEDLWPGDVGREYAKNLQTVVRMQESKAFTSLVAGVREEANPSSLAVFRVVFGPLSRIQRFLSAGRRFQTRRMGEAAIELITDPAKLNYYMSIKDWPIGSRRWARVIGELGLSAYFEPYDLADQDDLQSLSDQIRSIQNMMREE